MDIKLFKNTLFAEAKNYGFTDCEIYYVNSKSLQVSVFDKEISQYKNAKVSGVSFRGHVEGNIGYSYSEKIDLDVIPFLLKEAAENALMNESEKEALNADSKTLQFKDISKAETAPEDLIHYALDMERHAYEVDKRVKNIIHCTAGIMDSEVYISNTYGMDLHQQSRYSLAYLYVSVAAQGQVKVGGEIFCEKDFSRFSSQAMAQKAVEKGLNALGAKIPKSTKAKILLKNEAAIDLISTFIPNFYAENVQKGFSILNGKLGEVIAGSNITLCDRAKHPQALQTLNFDSEGVLVQDKNIIERGVLKSFFYNMKSAEKDGVKSTGNGYKSSFKAPVATACANLFFEPGEKTYDALVTSLDTGFIITQLSGLHAGTNRVSGDFSLLAEGFYVENGIIQYPVEQITAAGNFYDLLKNILALGSDLKFDLPGVGGSVGMPSMIINNINISGQ